jgi:hypothetical protein
MKEDRIQSRFDFPSSFTYEYEEIDDDFEIECVSDDEQAPSEFYMYNVSYLIEALENKGFCLWNMKGCCKYTRSGDVCWLKHFQQGIV